MDEIGVPSRFRERCETCLYGSWSDPYAREHEPGYAIRCRLDDQLERLWAVCDAWQPGPRAAPLVTISLSGESRQRRFPEPPWESAHELAALLALKTRGVVQR